MKEINQQAKEVIKTKNENDNQNLINVPVQKNPQKEDQPVLDRRAITRQKLYSTYMDVQNKMPGRVEDGKAQVQQINEGNAFSLQSTGMSPTLLAALEEIATDEHTASTHYFAPVVRAVTKLIDNAHDDESCSEGLSEVMASATYYLKKRGNRLFDTRRANRRAACSRIISEIAKFLQDAPKAYGVKINEKIESKRKGNGNLPKEWEKIRKENEPSLSDAVLEAKAAREALAQNPNYKELFDQMAKVDAMMQMHLPEYPGRSASAEEKRAYEKAVTTIGLSALMEYERTAKMAEDLSREDEVENRERADRIKEYYLDQRKLVENVMGRALSAKKIGETITWREAMRQEALSAPEQEAETIQELDVARRKKVRFRIDSFFGIDDMPGADVLSDNPATADVMKYVVNKAMSGITQKPMDKNDEDFYIDAIPLEFKRNVAAVPAETIELLISGIYDDDETKRMVDYYTEIQTKITESLELHDKHKKSNSKAERHGAIVNENDEYRALVYLRNALDYNQDIKQFDSYYRIDDLYNQWQDVKPSKEQMMENLRPDFVKIFALSTDSLFNIKAEDFSIEKYEEVNNLCDQITAFAEAEGLALGQEQAEAITKFQKMYQTYKTYLVRVDSFINDPGYKKLKERGYGLDSSGGIFPGTSKKELIYLRDNLAVSEKEKTAIAKLLSVIEGWHDLCVSNEDLIYDQAGRLYIARDGEKKEKKAQKAAIKFDMVNEIMSEALISDATKADVVLSDEVLRDKLTTMITGMYILKGRSVADCKGLYKKLARAGRLSDKKNFSEEDRQEILSGIEEVFAAIESIDMDKLSFNGRDDLLSGELNDRIAIINTLQSAYVLFDLYETLLKSDKRTQTIYDEKALAPLRAKVEAAEIIQDEYGNASMSLLAMGMKNREENISLNATEIVNKRRDKILSIIEAEELMKQIQISQKKKEIEEERAAIKPRFEAVQEKNRIIKAHKADVKAAKENYIAIYNQTFKDKLYVKMDRVQELTDKKRSEAGLIPDNKKGKALSRDYLIMAYFTSHELGEKPSEEDEIRQLQAAAITMSKNIKDEKTTGQEKQDKVLLAERYFKALLSFDIKKLNLKSFTDLKDMSQQHFEEMYTALWSTHAGDDLLRDYEYLLAEHEKQGDDMFLLHDEDDLVLSLTKEDLAEIREKINVMSANLSYIITLDNLLVRNSDIEDVEYYLDKPDLKVIEREMKEFRKKKDPRYSKRVYLYDRLVMNWSKQDNERYKMALQPDMQGYLNQKRVENKLPQEDQSQKIIEKLKSADDKEMISFTDRFEKELPKELEKERDELLKKQREDARKERLNEKKESKQKRAKWSKGEKKREEKELSGKVQRYLEERAINEPFDYCKRYAPQISARAGSDDMATATYTAVKVLGITEKHAGRMFDILGRNSEDVWKDVKSKEDMTPMKEKWLHEVETVMLTVLRYDIQNFDVDNVFDLIDDKNIALNFQMAWMSYEGQKYVEQYEKVMEIGDAIGYAFPITKQDIAEIRARMKIMGSYCDVFNLIRTYYCKDNDEFLYSTDFDELLKMRPEDIDEAKGRYDRQFGTVLERLSTLKENSRNCPLIPGKTFEQHCDFFKDPLGVNGDNSIAIASKLQRVWNKKEAELSEEEKELQVEEVREIKVIRNAGIPNPADGPINRERGRTAISNNYKKDEPVSKEINSIELRTDKINAAKKEIAEEEKKPKEKQREQYLAERKERIKVNEEKIDYIKRMKESKKPMEIYVPDRLYKSSSRHVKGNVDPKTPLFPTEDLKVGLKQIINDCYIVSPLYAMIEAGKGDYIKNTLVREYGEDGTKAVVRLYDEDGIPMDIVLDRSGFVDDERPLWFQLVEKAAAVVLNKNGFGDKNVKSHAGAGHAANVFWEKWNEGFCKDETLLVHHIADGSEDVGIKLLFGREALKFSTRGGDQYNNGFEVDEYSAFGDEAIGKIAELLDQGRVVVASSCDELTQEDLRNERKRSPGCERYEDNYNGWCDAVVYKIGDGIIKKHVYSVLSVHEASETIVLFNPLTGSEKYVRFNVFRRYFSDIRAV